MGSPIDEIEGAAKTVFDGARKLFLGLLAAGWTGLWLLVLLFGWIFALPNVMLASGVVLAITVVSLITARVVTRGRLARRAEHELIARARLDGVKLDRPMEEVLTVFDHDYRRVLALLAAPAGETVGPEAELKVDRLRERLYQLAIEKRQLLRQVKQVSRTSRSDVVRASLATTEREMSEKQREAERIAGEVQRLASRLSELQQLSAGGAAPAGSLTGVLDDLDRAASAYREIEEAESETERKLRALRAARKQAQ